MGESAVATEGVNGLANEQNLTNALNRYKALFRRAEVDAKDASDRMKERKAALREREDTQDALAAADETIKAARARANEVMEQDNEYADAKAEKTEARSSMREVLKEMKAAGIDVVAFKAALKLEQLDVKERETRFDNIDIYAKCLRLWGEPE